MTATDLGPRNSALAVEMMMTIATDQPRSPAVVMAPVAMMKTAMAQPRSPAAAMVPLARMMTATAQLRSPAAVTAPVVTMMTVMDREARHRAVDTDLRPAAVETMMTTAMAPQRSLVAAMALATLVPLTTRQATHLAVTIGMTRAVCKRN